MLISKIFWTNLVITFLFLILAWLSCQLDEDSKLTTGLVYVFGLSTATTIITGVCAALTVIWL